jgi:hypothetical protein
MKRSGMAVLVRQIINSVYPSYSLNPIGRFFLKTGIGGKLQVVKDSLEKPSYHTWVSLKHKYFYLGIPKVACTRVKLILQEFEGYPVPSDTGKLHHRLDQSQPWVPKLTDLSIDERKAALNSKEWFRFSFVRNPYNRLFSAYKSKILNQRDTEYEEVREKIRKNFGYPVRTGKPAAIVSFRDFVRYVCESPSNRLDGHWAPQTPLLMLDLINYDFVGRFENFQSEFSQVLHRLGANEELKKRAQTPVGKTIQIPPGAVYDRETASWVYDVYREDFDNFGYDRDSWLFDNGA